MRSCFSVCACCLRTSIALLYHVLFVSLCRVLICFLSFKFHLPVSGITGSHYHLSLLVDVLACCYLPARSPVHCLQSKRDSGSVNVRVHAWIGENSARLWSCDSSRSLL